MKSSRLPAFSLAETLFAMAIVSFALLAIIGLMPTSLAELNDAEHRAAEARILQSINSEYGLKLWKTLKDQSASQVIYFGLNGAALNDQDKTQAHYAALVEPVQSTSAVSGELMLPGEGNAGGYLRCLRVAITGSPNNPQALGPLDQANRHLRRDYAIVLINREPDDEQL